MGIRVAVKNTFVECLGAAEVPSQRRSSSWPASSRRVVLDNTYAGSDNEPNVPLPIGSPTHATSCREAAVSESTASTAAVSGVVGHIIGDAGESPQQLAPVSPPVTALDPQKVVKNVTKCRRSTRQQNEAVLGTRPCAGDPNGSSQHLLKQSASHSRSVPPDGLLATYSPGLSPGASQQTNDASCRRSTMLHPPSSAPATSSTSGANMQVSVQHPHLPSKGQVPVFCAMKPASLTDACSVPFVIRRMMPSCTPASAPQHLGDAGCRYAPPNRAMLGAQVQAAQDMLPQKVQVPLRVSERISHGGPDFPHLLPSIDEWPQWQISQSFLGYSLPQSTSLNGGAAETQLHEDAPATPKRVQQSTRSVQHKQLTPQKVGGASVPPPPPHAPPTLQSWHSIVDWNTRQVAAESDGYDWHCFDVEAAASRPSTQLASSTVSGVSSAFPLECSSVGSTWPGGRPRNRRWCCFYLLMVASGFDLVPIIIGRRGCNTSRIAKAAGAKIRVRGQGSGHLENATGREAPVPLMLVIAAETGNFEGFATAVKQCIDLLRNVEKRYRAHCTAKGITPITPAYPFGPVSDRMYSELAQILNGVAPPRMPNMPRLHRRSS